jgi:hypothetical protein
MINPNATTVPVLTDLSSFLIAVKFDLPKLGDSDLIQKTIFSAGISAVQRL